MLSEQILGLIENHEKIALQDIKKVMGASSFGLLICLIALPSALPLPAPGYSLPFGIMLIILATQMLIGRRAPWIPKSINEKSFKLAGYRPKIKLIVRFISFFERFVRPRFSFIFSSKSRFLALMILICGLLMCVPIPGTNTIPALASFVIGLALIERDGLMGLFGCFLASVGIVVSTGIIFFGVQLLQWLS